MGVVMARTRAADVHSPAAVVFLRREMHIEKRQWVWAAVGFGVSSIPRIILTCLLTTGYSFSDNILLFLLGLDFGALYHNVGGILIATQIPLSLFFAVLLFLSSGIKSVARRRGWLYFSFGLLVSVTLFLSIYSFLAVTIDFIQGELVLLVVSIISSLLFATLLGIIGGLRSRRKV